MDTKTYNTVTTQIPENAHPHTPVRSRSNVSIRGRTTEILLAFSIMTIPLICFSALLLGLLFHFRVKPSGSISSNLSFDTDYNESNVIYIRMSATTFTTIASWSSTVAPLLVGFAVTLVSYPVAKSILVAAQKNDVVQLPTPFQLSLVLRILSGGYAGSLLSWLQYTFGWLGKREGHSTAIKRTVTILFLGTLFSVLVLITDTWLHFTTKTVNFIQVEQNTIPSNHSFALAPNCLNSTALACTLNMAAANTFLLGGADALRTLSNLSETISVKTHTTSSGEEYAYISPPPRGETANIDYMARSWAVTSICQPVTNSCVKYASGPMAAYSCNFAFEGTIETTYRNTMNMAYFTNSTGKKNSTTEEHGNPYYYSAILSVNQNAGHAPQLMHDPDLSSGLHGSTLFALFCNATVYDLTYTSVNGSIGNFALRKSNATAANIIRDSQAYTHVGDANLIQAASVAALISNSATEIASQFANAYSQTVLAVAAGAFVPTRAVEAQLRTNILVARVPIAPLIALIASNLLLVCLGLFLTIIAFITARGEVGEVQARLSVQGLVAAAFEGARADQRVKSMNDVFEETQSGRGPHVGVVPTDQGGWRFATWGRAS